jgi:hypothetical protein
VSPIDFGALRTLLLRQFHDEDVVHDTLVYVLTTQPTQVEHYARRCAAGLRKHARRRAMREAHALAAVQRATGPLAPTQDDYAQMSRLPPLWVAAILDDRTPRHTRYTLRARARAVLEGHSRRRRPRGPHV